MLVKVENKTFKKDHVGSGGKPHAAWLVTLTNVETGETKEKALAVFGLDKVPGLIDKLKQTEIGKVYDFKYQKNGNFINLVDIVGASEQGTTRQNAEAPTATPRPSTATFKSSYDNVGAQVGGALHDAVKLAIARKQTDIDKVEAAAREILALQEKLKKDLAGGNIEAQPVVSKKEPTEKKPVVEQSDVEVEDFEDEIPF